MNQKALSELAKNSLRLSALTEKHQRKLEEALTRWFLTEFLNVIKLPMLRNIYDTGAYNAFIALLAEKGDAERIKVLHRVDEHNPKVQMLSTKDAFAHLERLAKGQIQSHPKPQQSRKKSNNKVSPSRRGVLANSKY